MKMCGRYLMFCYSFFGLFCLAFGSKKEDYDGNIKRPRKPHIIMILADDMVRIIIMIFNSSLPTFF